MIVKDRFSLKPCIMKEPRNKDTSIGIEYESEIRCGGAQGTLESLFQSHVTLYLGTKYHY